MLSRTARLVTRSLPAIRSAITAAKQTCTHKTGCRCQFHVPTRSFTGKTPDAEAEKMHQMVQASSKKSKNSKSETTQQSTEEQIEYIPATPQVDSTVLSLEQRLRDLPTLYTSLSIDAHTSEHVGQYYQISDETLKTMPYSWKMRTLPVEMKRTGNYMMIRQSGLDCVKGLKKIQETFKKGETLPLRGFSKPYAITGVTGSGKTATLYYSIQYARSQGWLVLSTYGTEFTTEKLGFIKPSTLREGIFEQPLYTSYYFQQLLSTESAALQQIKLKSHQSKSIVWGDEDTDYTVGTTLYDLVTLGANNPEQAPSLLRVLAYELLRSTEVPVLVAIDNVNTWDSVSQFVDPVDYTALDSRRLGLVDVFNLFTKITPRTGMSMFATTGTAATLTKTPDYIRNDVVREIRCVPYTEQEMRYALAHYHVSGVLLAEIDPVFIGRTQGMTGRVPALVYDWIKHF